MKLRDIFKKREPYWPNIVPEAYIDDILDLFQKIAPYTMTGPERIWAMFSASEYIDKANIEGDVVECGVWRGGNMILAKRVHQRLPLSRQFWLYDTFAGMSEPTKHDRSFAGPLASSMMAKYATPTHSEWCYASLEDVKANFEKFRALDDSVKFIKGKVEDTLKDPKNLPGKIALLRLDTDWYESTKIELEVLYPRLVPGGVCIIDDYGHWRGARKAVDEYFADQAILLQRIDYTARMFVKR
jgi:O-methyltransferase